MIKVTNILNKKLNYNVIYYRKSQALDIEVIPKCENFTPFLESKNCVLLLDKDNVLCEVEYLFPNEIETSGLYMNDSVKVFVGTPVLSINYDDNPVELYYNTKQIVLVFDKERYADAKIVSSNLVYYLAGEQVIAISCCSFKLI